MPIKPGVNVKVVFNRIPQVSADIRSGGAALVQETAGGIAEDAAGRAPVRTGELRDSIEATGNGLKSQVTVGAEHGIYVEYGTSRMAAQPFLWPAVEAARSRYRESWRALLNGAGRAGSVTVLPGRGTTRRRRPR